jgi:transcriptional regulator with XRE-family HTH domain
MTPQQTLTPREFADRTGVPYSTVSYWCRTGAIKARKNAAGVYEIPLSELEKASERDTRKQHGDLMKTGRLALALARDRAANRLAQELRDEARELVRRYDGVQQPGYRATAEWAEPLLRVARRFDALRHFDTASAELSTYDETGELVPE